MDKKVTGMLAATEESLAKLSGDYAALRNYDRATLVLSMAREIGALANRWSQAIGASPSAGEMASASAPEGGYSQEAISTPKRHGGKKSAYPKFYRHGDWLIKIGYSKSEGEYEHKSLKSVLFLLAAAFLKAGAKGARFSMNDVLPLATAEGTEIPSYQPYLCLNWLREAGLVRQHGRRGYSIPRANDWLASVQARWEQLPSPVRA